MFLKESIKFLKDITLALIIAIAIYIFQYLSTLVINLSGYFKEINTLNIIIYSIIAIFLATLEILVVYYYKKKNEPLDIIKIEEKKNKKVKLLIKLLILLSTCLISFFLGFALGGEGPSVLLGSILGIIIGRIFEHDETNEALVKLGESIGFSLAFLNPIAGIFKFFKDRKFDFSNMLQYLRVIVSVIVSYLFLSLLKGSFTFNLFFNITDFINYRVGWIFLIIPIIVFIFTYFYKVSLKYFKKIISKNKIIAYIIFPILLVILSITIKYLLPIVEGSGANLFSNILVSSSLIMLFLYLMIRFIYVVFSFGSEFEGGVVLPTISIGAILGRIIGDLLSLFINISDNDKLIIIIVTLILFYAFTFKELLVGISLIFSFGNPLYIFPGLVISSVISYLIIKVFKIKGLHEYLNENHKVIKLINK